MACPRNAMETFALRRRAQPQLAAGVETSSLSEADWAGCVLRIAGHDFMDYVKKAGKGLTVGVCRT